MKSFKRPVCLVALCKCNQFCAWETTSSCERWRPVETRASRHLAPAWMSQSGELLHADSPLRLTRGGRLDYLLSVSKLWVGCPSLPLENMFKQTSFAFCSFATSHDQRCIEMPEQMSSPPTIYDAVMGSCKNKMTFHAASNRSHSHCIGKHRTVDMRCSNRRRVIWNLLMSSVVISKSYL